MGQQWSGIDRAIIDNRTVTAGHGSRSGHVESVQKYGRGKVAAGGHHLGKLGDHVHDRFHISQHLNEAVDKVRRQENKALKAAGDRRLAGAKFNWLVNEGNLNEVFAEQFSELKQADLKVSRAWAIKESFRGFWGYRYAGWARRHFDKWYAWAIRCRLQPIKEKARMIKNHLPHILTCFKHRISNAGAEGLNSKIQTVKANARGYRSFDGFRNSILFYCGGLDMTP